METPNPVRVLLVDDHTVVRRGLRRVLDASDRIHVVGEANDGADAIAASLSLRPDVILMDVGLPGMNGIEATRHIVEASPSIAILMLSMYGDLQYLQQSREAGARGYLRKDVDIDELVASILAVAAGQLAFRLDTAPGAAPRAADPAALSPRERQVVAGIARGSTTRDIADRLGISVFTVETHRKHIQEKLDLHSTADLVRFAVKHGLCDDETS